MFVGDSDWDECAFKVVGYPVLYLRGSEIPRIKVSSIYIVKSMRELKDLISELCSS